MRRAARIDANHAAIVEGLRARGCSVQPLALVGSGCPDLLVGVRGENFLLEVKAQDGRRSDNPATWERQEHWRQVWRGQVCVVRCLGDAIYHLELPLEPL